jgi:CheY-like chemotaxis protein
LEIIYWYRNGFEAVNLCKNNPDIDIILMDIQMPIMNGYEAIKKIREFNEDVHNYKAHSYLRTKLKSN